MEKEKGEKRGQKMKKVVGYHEPKQCNSSSTSEERLVAKKVPFDTAGMQRWLSISSQ